MNLIRPFLCAAFAIGLSFNPLHAQTVSIFAASSLKTAIDQVITENALDAVAVYAGSASLARQIDQGAKADIVILAHPLWMDWLDRKGALADGSRCNVIGNSLVIASQAGALDKNFESAQDVLDALNGGRVAVGQLQSVPVGQYAAEYMEKMGWLEDLRPHLAQTSNVRLALALVARAEVPLGFVYASDTAVEDKVKPVFVPDPKAYPPIRYPMALTATADDASRSIADLITQSGQVFDALGFSTVPDDETGRCK